MASPPAWTNSAGMLFTSADFPVFSALTDSLLSLVVCLGHLFSPAVSTPLQTACLYRVTFS